MMAVPGWRLFRVLTWVTLVAMSAPVLVGLGAAALDSNTVDPATLGFRGGEVLWVTMAWSLGLAAVAVVVGSIPGSR